jgi:hypothetical protein
MPVPTTPQISVPEVSGVRSSAFNSPLIYTPQWAKGAIITLVASAATGATTMQLQYSPNGSGGPWINLGPVSSALSGAGNAALLFYPTNLTVAGATPAALTLASTAAGVLVNCPLPPHWRISFTVGTSITITGLYVTYCS